MQAAQVATNDTQRRHLRQLQHGGQTKSHQQGQAHGHAHQSRLHGGVGQLCIDQTRQQNHKAQVHGVACQHAHGTGQKACAQKLQAIAQGECALALTQNAQQGTGIELPLGETAGGQGHGHGAEQGGQQGHQVQKLGSTVQRLAHFGAPAVERLDLHAAHMGLVHLRPCPLDKAFGRRGIARHRHAPSDAAGGLHQAGRCQIGRVHHDAGGKGHETCAPVGFALDDGRDAETAFAQAQRVPGFQVQVVEQRGVHPHFARGGDGGFEVRSAWLAHIVQDEQLAAQGVPGLHRLECDQSTGTALLCQGAGHGGKAHIGVGLQAQALGPLHKGSGGGLVTDHHRIAAEQLTRITPQT